MILAALRWIGRRAAEVLAVGVLIGLALPGLASLLKPVLVPLVVLFTITSMVRIDWPEVGRMLRRPGLLAVMLAWVLVGAPLAMAAALRLLPMPPPLEAALVLQAAAPPITAAAAIALMLGLDAGLAVLATVLGTLAVPFTLPWLVLALAGLPLALEPAALFLRLVSIIGGSIAAGLAIRRWLGARRLAEHGAVLSGITVVALLLFAVAVMDGVLDRMLTRPGEVALYAAAAFGGNLGLQLLGALLFRPLGRVRALTLGLVSGNCNMALVWAGLGPDAPEEMTLFLAMAQFPIYMLPALQAPLFRRLLGHQPG